MAIVDFSGPATGDCDGLVAGMVAGSETWPIPYTIAVTAVADARHARGPDGRLFSASASTGGSLVARYYADDDGTAAGVTVESAGVTSCSLGVQSSGIVDLFYAQSGDTFLRASRDAGHTWTAAAAVQAGYSRVVHWLDDATGDLLLMLWDPSDEFWYESRGTLNEAGTAWSFSTPSAVVPGSGKPGQLRRMASGAWTFAYADSAEQVHVIWNPAGSWETLADTLASGYSHVTHWHEDPGGLLVLLAYRTSNDTWYVINGTWDAAGAALTWATPVAVTASAGGAELAGSVRRFVTGRYELSLATTAGGFYFLRAKSLSASGVGLWA